MKKLCRFTHAVLILGLLAVLTPLAGAQDGLALMQVEAGARPAGMGAAFAAVGSDANGTFYNPAASVGVAGMEGSFGINTYWENISIQTLYATTHFKGKVWLHGGLRYAGISDLESRLGPSSAPDSYFEAHDISFKGGLGFQLTDKIRAGAALGWFIEKIDIYRGSAFNVDLGVQYVNETGLSLGASATNLGSDFSLSLQGQEGGAEISLPTTYRVGAAYRYQMILGTADLVHINDQGHLHVGAEGALHEKLLVRAGYMTSYESKSFTAGASIKHHNFSFDYAFVPFTNDLGTSHLFNITFTM